MKRPIETGLCIGEVEFVEDNLGIESVEECHEREGEVGQNRGAQFLVYRLCLQTLHTRLVFIVHRSLRPECAHLGDAGNPGFHQEIPTHVEMWSELDKFHVGLVQPADGGFVTRGIIAQETVAGFTVEPFDQKRRVGWRHIFFPAVTGSGTGLQHQCFGERFEFTETRVGGRRRHHDELGL